MEYEVRTPLFEGPFDLLLFFIERDELDIHSISLGSITGEFLRYLQQMTTLNLDLASEFIWVAATLMKIKARQLLPRPKVDAEDSDLDQEQALVARLIEYKKFKNLLPGFIALEEARALLFNRGNMASDLERLALCSGITGAVEVLENLSLYQLLISYKRVLDRKKPIQPRASHVVVTAPYSLVNQRKKILELIALNEQLDFYILSRHSADRLQFVYSFLAMLELVQEQILRLYTGGDKNSFWINAG